MSSNALRYLLGIAAAGLALGATIAIAGVAAPALSPTDDYDIRGGYTLLETTFYASVTPHQLLEGERTALLAYLRKRGARNPQIAAVPGSPSMNAGMDDAIAMVRAALQQGPGSSPDATTYAGLAGMALAVGDKYTAFFTPAEYKAFMEPLDPTKISGIGVLMDVDDATKYIRAFFVVPGTPADRAGIKSGDLLEEVDGHSTHGFTIEQASKLLRGKTGTQVQVDVLHVADESKNLLTLTRDVVQPPTVYFSMLPNRIAYIYVGVFGDATPREFDAALERMQAADARAYVLDVRNDGGGIVDTAISLVAHFVASGPIVSVQSNGGKVQTVEANDTAISPKPIVVLVNKYSASAAEIAAAALQESGVAKLVGNRTFGKGVVQTVTRFPDGSAIKITTGRYLTPLNHDINHAGIRPDVEVVENPRAQFGIVAKDAQLARAVDILQTTLAAQTPATSPSP
jgi:carboxyl-terminal processing protease